MPPGACNIFFSKPNTLKSAVNWVISWVFARLLTYRVNCLWHDAAESFFPAAAAISKFITFCDDIFAWVFFFLCHCIYWHFSAAQYLIRLIHCALFVLKQLQAMLYVYIYLPIQISLTKRHVVIEFWNESIMQEFVFGIFPGSETRYRHQLKGYLAGLSYLPDGNENPEVLKCLHQCSESLQIPSLQDSSTKLLSPGMQVL